MDSASPSPKYDAGPRPGARGNLRAVPSFQRVPGEATVARFHLAFTDKRVMWRSGQLREAGFDERSIKSLVERGEILRLRQGCYIRRSFWDRQTNRRQETLRIVLHHFGTLNSSSPGFIYSHVSAARLHGLYLWQADTLIHLTQPHKPSSVGAGKDCRIHVRPLPAEDIVRVNGLRVTSLERTVIDCCLTMHYRQALVLTDHALHLGASAAKLHAAADKLGSHRGIRTLRKVLKYADRRSESPGETLARDLMRELLIVTPVPQLWIPTRMGAFRADFGWPEQRLILEFDGRTKYFDYAPTEQVLLAERQRENALIEDGWRVIRMQWKDLFNEASFKARILAALAR